MSWRVWKWTFAPDAARQSWLMPEGSRIVHVGQDPGTPFLTVAIWTQHWVLAEDDKETRTFELVGTGQETKLSPWAIVGTAVLGNGLVLHVYEVVDRRGAAEETTS